MTDVKLNSEVNVSFKSVGSEVECARTNDKFLILLHGLDAPKVNFDYSKAEILEVVDLLLETKTPKGTKKSFIRKASLVRYQKGNFIPHMRAYKTMRRRLLELIPKYKLISIRKDALDTLNNMNEDSSCIVLQGHHDQLSLDGTLNLTNIRRDTQAAKSWYFCYMVGEKQKVKASFNSQYEAARGQDCIKVMVEGLRAKTVCSYTIKEVQQMFQQFNFEEEEEWDQNLLGKLINQANEQKFKDSQLTESEANEPKPSKKNRSRSNVASRLSDQGYGSVQINTSAPLFQNYNMNQHAQAAQAQ